MINKKINIPIFTLKDLITPIILIGVIYFTFKNYNSTSFLKKQDKKLENKYDSISKESVIFKKALLKLDQVLKVQSDISQKHKSNFIKLKKTNVNLKKDYEKANNNIDNLNSKQLDSSITEMLRQLEKKDD